MINKKSDKNTIKFLTNRINGLQRKLELQKELFDKAEAGNIETDTLQLLLYYKELTAEKEQKYLNLCKKYSNLWDIYTVLLCKNNYLKRTYDMYLKRWIKLINEKTETEN